jgi:hypothetical protein
MLNTRHDRAARSGLSLLSAVLLLALIGVIVVAVVRHANDRPVIVHTSGGTAGSGNRSEASPTATTPAPVSPGFEGCPPVGDGGDRELNYLKNRVDSGAWKSTPFETVLQSPWPSRVTRRARAEWSASDSVAVSKREGLPVTVEGFFAGAKQEGPEATNCHGADRTFRDWHLWLTPQPGKDRRHAIVVETTPAVRAMHPEWSLTTIHQLVRDSTPVRVSGWLLLDQEHPEQLGKTRGTLWEIHPVLRIEVKREGRWTPLSG